MSRGLYPSADPAEPHSPDGFLKDLRRPLFNVPAHSDGPSILMGTKLSRPLGGTLVGTTAVEAASHRGEPLDGDLGQYGLQLLTSGMLRGDCDGAAIEAGPGDICLFDLSRPYAVEATEGSRLTVILPRWAIDQAVRGRNLHGLVLRAADPLARLLRTFVVSVQAVADQLQADDAEATEAALLELLITILARRRPEAPTSVTPSLGRRFRQRMIDFIDQHIADGRLGADCLMQEFGVSRAHLYRLFAEDGGVASAIRDRRLDAARHRLAAGERSVTEIAFDLGFSSSGQFSRAFRNRFGISPTEARGDTKPSLDLPAGAAMTPAREGTGR